MLVEVEGNDVPFVTILPDGNCVSVIKGQKISLPEDRADALLAAGLVRRVAVKQAAPENKSAGPAPEVKTTRKRRATPADAG